MNTIVDPNNIQMPEDGRTFPFVLEWDGHGWNIFWKKYEIGTEANHDALIGHVGIDTRLNRIWVDWLEFANVIFDPNERGNEYDSFSIRSLVDNCMKSCMKDGGYTRRYTEPEDWYERVEHGDFDEI